MLQEEKFKSMVDSGMQGSHAFTLQNNCGPVKKLYGTDNFSREKLEFLQGHRHL